KLLHASFADLNKALTDAVQSSAQQSEALKKSGGKRDPLQFRVANRLYGQSGQEFRKSFLELLREVYRAPLEQVDFKSDPEGISKRINIWVAEQTSNRIQNLIPPGILTRYTRLVLVNALYFKAAWQDAFQKGRTSPRPFHVRGAANTTDVPTMMRRGMI